MKTKFKTFHLVLLALTLSIINFFIGSRQFAGYDFSPATDVAWRLASSQTPHVDFLASFPPSFSTPLGALCKAGWCEYTSSAFLSSFFLFLSFITCFLASKNQGHSTPTSLSISLLVGSTVVLYYGFFWHNSLALLSCICVILLCSGSTHQIEKNSTSILIGFWMSIAFLGKINLAAVALTSSILLLTLAKPKASSIFKILASLAITSTAILAPFKWNPFRYVKESIAIGSDRPLFPSFTGSVNSAEDLLLKSDAKEFLLAIVLPRSFQEIILIPLLVFILIIIATKTKKTKCQAINKEKPRLIAGLSLLTCAVASAFTNGDSLAPIQGVVLLSLIWMPRTLENEEQAWRAKVASVAIVAFCLPFLYKSLARERVELAGELAFFGHPVAQGDAGSYFHGSMVWAGLLQLEKDAKLLPQEAKVFFGPRLEFLYAATKRPSPKGLPLWWDPRGSYAPNLEGEAKKSFAQAKFDYAVFSRLYINYDIQTLLPLFAKEELAGFATGCMQRKLPPTTHLVILQRPGLSCEADT